MSRIVDNLIAYRILSMLVTPFDKTSAYRLGIIDEEGKILRKMADLRTDEERNAYTYLHRLVFNLKRILIKLPGGDSKLKNIVAAFFLYGPTFNQRFTLFAGAPTLIAARLIPSVPPLSCRPPRQWRWQARDARRRSAPE